MVCCSTCLVHRKLVYLVVLLVNEHAVLLTHRVHLAIVIPCRHLWQSCVGLLTQLDNGSEACLRLQQVHSLAELEEQHGPYDAVVVAAGAAAGVLPEVGAAPLQVMCRLVCCCRAKSALAVRCIWHTLLQLLHSSQTPHASKIAD